ncbi:MAG: metallophosphoesterase [Candidatus Dormibacteraeota bacterium]|uniref:Metallophosphoesterase n=1 Tax=Candidatus Dormiibacter inghamiae TaxID=3127013 RepID=A0A934NB73_9BACT|nr:metallophosphoesterase [Candidatus Dormibacteraeota bacterium]MBJ7605613.1 metallophosphoesterase [Candidatus Dormibacteraeota bacterium]
MAAVGDLHVKQDGDNRLQAHLREYPEEIDLLLLAGDLTYRGTPAEARRLAQDLAGLPCPVLAVLGNHDFHEDQSEVVIEELEAVGVRFLEGAGQVLQLAAGRIGVAGVKGWCGGFEGTCATPFGEPEMKEFVDISVRSAQSLWQALAALDASYKIALLHYSPIRATLAGEPPELWPFLGSYLLGDAADGGGASLVLHGHAHYGSFSGATAKGTPVHNVAASVLGRPFHVFEVDLSRAAEPAAEPTSAPTEGR